MYLCVAIIPKRLMMRPMESKTVEKSSTQSNQKPSGLIIRLRRAMEAKQLNARELASRAGVGPSFVYDILSGKSANPTTSKLAKVAEVLDVTLPFLLKGETASRSALQDAVAVPQISMSSDFGRPGATRSLLDKQPFYFARQWVEQTLGSNPQDLRLLTVEGDAMSPTIERGDKLLIDTGRSEPSPPGVFAIYDGMALVIKRIEYIKDGNDSMIVARTDNEHYPPQKRKPSDIHIIGRVVWHSRLV